VIVSYETANCAWLPFHFYGKRRRQNDAAAWFQHNKIDRVLVVEDVITTGGSTKEVIDVVNDMAPR